MKTITSRLQQKLTRYVESFNSRDEVIYPRLITNEAVLSYLSAQIPLLECPDPELEEIYYFRWWTFRKHWKATKKGHILTEFLPDVPWSGPYNSINCAACLHIREGRWLADPNRWLQEYIDFWLNGHGNTDSYSAWYAHALWEYCMLHEDISFGIQRLPQLIACYERREKKHLRSSGLYWSNDDRDGMEYSISGPGLRPTINSYACADASAISRFASLAGEDALARRYQQKADKLKQAIDTFLWDGDFYKTIPAEESDDLPLVSRPAVDSARNVRELIGYIPWYFDLPNEEKYAAFRALLQRSGFFAPAGLTTAEQSHPRFMERHDHECLWNGPVWPYATSQTLVAAANALRRCPQPEFTREDYYALLLQYARSHHRVEESGQTLPWIDENLDPYTGRWISREILKDWGWRPEVGGYERGKDYNHSLFCDLVLSGLLGIKADAQTGISVHPLIPDWWDYFCVDNLTVRGRKYRVFYDKHGTHYGIRPGISIQRLS